MNQMREKFKPDYATIGYLPQDEFPYSPRCEKKLKRICRCGRAQEKLDDAEKTREMEPDTEEFYDLIDQMGAEEQLASYELEKMNAELKDRWAWICHRRHSATRRVLGGGKYIALENYYRGSLLILTNRPITGCGFQKCWSYWNYQGDFGISHDRAFLESVTERTIELKLGKLNHYKGNYTFYLEESAARIERQRKAAVNQKKEIQKEKEFINRFRSNVKKAAMVQSRIKALEKMEIIKPEAEEKKIYFRFPPSPPSSHKVGELEGLHKSYGELEVFDGLDLRIEKGDRIAVVG